MKQENDKFNSQILNLISDQLNFVQKSVMITLSVREKKFVSMVNVKKAAQMIMIANGVKNVTKTNAIQPVAQFLNNLVRSTDLPVIQINIVILIIRFVLKNVLQTLIVKMVTSVTKENVCNLVINLRILVWHLTSIVMSK